MRLLRTSLIAASLVATQLAQATEWIDRGSDNGVALYERADTVNGFKGFRGVIKVNAPLKTVLALILVRETFSKWVANMIEDSTLPNGNTDGSLCYMWIKGVWPTNDRDVVCKATVSQDPKTLAISVVAEDADPKLVPHVPGRVRMSKLYSGFTARALTATQTEVQLDAIADPAGNIPSFAANIVSKTMPRDTLLSLAKLAETPGAVDLTALETNTFASLAMKKIVLPKVE